MIRKAGKLFLTFLSEPKKTPKKDQNYLSFSSFWVSVVLYRFLHWRTNLGKGLKKGCKLSLPSFPMFCACHISWSAYVVPLEHGFNSPPKSASNDKVSLLLNGKDTWKRKVEWSKRKVPSVRQEKGKC
jgi:hypothetical protein